MTKLEIRILTTAASLGYTLGGFSLYKIAAEVNAYENVTAEIIEHEIKAYKGL